jgi:hypothetical protein
MARLLWRGAGPLACQGLRTVRAYRLASTPATASEPSWDARNRTTPVTTTGRRSRQTCITVGAMTLSADQCATYAQVATGFVVALAVAIGLWTPAPDTTPAVMAVLGVPLVVGGVAVLVALDHTDGGATGWAAFVIREGTLVCVALTVVAGALYPFGGVFLDRRIKRQARRVARRAARAAARAEVRREQLEADRRRHEEE